MVFLARLVYRRVQLGTQRFFDKKQFFQATLVGVVVFILRVRVPNVQLPNGEKVHQMVSALQQIKPHGLAGIHNVFKQPHTLSHERQNSINEPREYDIFVNFIILFMRERHELSRLQAVLGHVSPMLRMQRNMYHRLIIDNPHRFHGQDVGNVFQTGNRLGKNSFQRGQGCDDFIEQEFHGAKTFLFGQSEQVDFLRRVAIQLQISNFVVFFRKPRNREIFLFQRLRRSGRNSHI